MVKFFLQCAAFLSFIFTYMDCSGKEVAKAAHQELTKHEASKPLDDYVKKIEDYFNNISVFFADFTQKNKDGSKSCGYFLMKERKLKMEYTIPATNVVIIKNNKVILFDNELKEKTVTSAYSSPFSFLLRRKIDLRKNLEILAFSEDEKTTSISLRNKNDDNGIMITIYFSKNPITLLGWEIFPNHKDLKTEMSTKITLHNHDWHRKISDNEFNTYD